MISLSIVIFLFALIVSALCCAQVLNYARRHKLFDRPNERSLHAQPIPSGGGAGMLISTTICLLGLSIFGYLPIAVMTVWIVCGFCLGLLGWIDDHRGIGTGLRFVIQLVIATSFIVGLLRVTSTELPAWLTENYHIVVAVGALGTVWIINLTNFMDGSDGYAASEGVLVAGIGGIVAGQSGGHWTQLVGLCVAGGAAGFLIWNWHPAKIFMGDVGSYFLGFQFAGLIAVDIVNGVGPWVWLILFTPFVVDASLTLGLRIVTRRAWWTAHRSHLYQRMILGGYSHRVIALGMIVLTVIVLTPIALIAAAKPIIAPLITAFVYALAAIIWAVKQNKFNRRVS
jgi:Fuc2NAc and GlcNAc transferase